MPVPPPLPVLARLPPATPTPPLTLALTPRLPPQAHWVVEGARTRCVVLAEGDPAPCEGSAPSGRMSFGGFSPSAEQAQQEDEAAAALAEAEAANPDGKAVSDAAMAASLQRQQGGKSKKQRHGGGDGGGRHSGGKRRGRDDGGEDRQEKKKKSTGRYF